MTRQRRKAAEPLREGEVYVVSSPCDCDDPGCYGQTDIAVITDPQLAMQAAEQRSRRWGGHKDRPDLHLNRVKVQTKLGEY